MKQFINSKTIPLLVLISSLVAMGIRFWTRSGGPDGAGLFEQNTLAWVLLWVLTAAVLGACMFAVRGLKNPGTYQDNYPQSTVAGLCAAPAAIAFLVSGYSQLKDTVGYGLPGTTVVDTITGILGLVAGLCLLLSAVHRLMGRQPFFLINGLVCLYLALRLFNRCQVWSNEPQMGIVIFPFLASTALMLSAYYRVCFDVDLGNRRWSAFWTLASVYFCVVAMISFEQSLFYGLCALWQMTDLCSMRPLKRKPQVETEVPENPETIPEAETPEAEE